MKAEGAAAMAIAQNSVRGIGPTVIAGHRLVRDRQTAVGQTGVSAEITTAIGDVCVRYIRAEEANRSDRQGCGERSDAA